MCVNQQQALRTKENCGDIYPQHLGCHPLENPEAAGAGDGQIQQKVVKVLIVTGYLWFNEKHQGVGGGWSGVFLFWSKYFYW